MNPTDQYEDIMALPRHRSPRRAPMSRADRAAQFAPFAALTGFDGVIAETGRLTDSCNDLTEGEVALLDGALRQIYENIDAHPQVTITYFQPDGRKKGGAYVSAAGQVRKIDLYKREVHFLNGTVIPIDRIYGIEEVPVDAKEKMP